MDEGTRFNMSKVYEMIYLPTAQCNCRCAHCGLNFDTVDDNEKSCAEVADAIIKSKYINSNVVVQICGGEPFLRNDIAGFVIPLLKTFESCYVSITTNGISTSNIANFADSIPPNLRSRVGFAISIDGIGETHNQIRKYKNAYNLAIQTTKIVASRGFKLHINTVIHEENIDQLKEMKRLFSNIPISFIPICTDVSCDENFPYSDGAIQAFFSYLNNHPFFIKYICSKGHMSPPTDVTQGRKISLSCRMGILSPATLVLRTSRIQIVITWAISAIVDSIMYGKTATNTEL